MKDESVRARSLSIVGKDKKDERSLSASLKNIREEIWDTIQDLKEKKADPIMVRQFLSGCTVIMNSMKLEISIFEMIEKNEKKKGLKNEPF